MDVDGTQNKHETCIPCNCNIHVYYRYVYIYTHTYIHYYIIIYVIYVCIYIYIYEFVMLNFRGIDQDENFPKNAFTKACEDPQAHTKFSVWHPKPVSLIEMTNP